MAENLFPQTNHSNNRLRYGNTRSPNHPLSFVPGRSNYKDHFPSLDKTSTSRFPHTSATRNQIPPDIQSQPIPVITSTRDNLSQINKHTMGSPGNDQSDQSSHESDPSHIPHPSSSHTPPTTSIQLREDSKAPNNHYSSYYPPTPPQSPPKYQYSSSHQIPTCQHNYGNNSLDNQFSQACSPSRQHHLYAEDHFHPPYPGYYPPLPPFFQSHSWPYHGGFPFYPRPHRP